MGCDLLHNLHDDPLLSGVLQWTTDSGTLQEDCLVPAGSFVLVLVLVLVLVTQRESHALAERGTHCETPRRGGGPLQGPSREAQYTVIVHCSTVDVLTL